MAQFVDNYSDLKELGIDCDDSLTEVFNRAADHLKTLLPGVDSNILLMLYGYYKQGSEGSCNIPKPSWYDMKAKSKWEAWHKLGKMPQPEAKRLYIESIKKLDPDFNDSTEGISPMECWIKVSSLHGEELIAESEKTLVDYIKEGNVKGFEKQLKDNACSIDLINKRDNDGMALIHWSADSGSPEIIDILVKSGADVNLQDADGQTALHYASSCGHKECVKLLLECGCKPDVVDNEGLTALSVASDIFVQELLTQLV